jgi:hypothetical protein
VPPYNRPYIPGRLDPEPTQARAHVSGDTDEGCRSVETPPVASAVQERPVTLDPALALVLRIEAYATQAVEERI